jgi:hypothetical protein
MPLVHCMASRPEVSPYLNSLSGPETVQGFVLVASMADCCRGSLEGRPRGSLFEFAARSARARRPIVERGPLLRVELARS